MARKAMPAFPPDHLSDHEIGDIIAYRGTWLPEGIERRGRRTRAFNRGLQSGPRVGAALQKGAIKNKTLSTALSSSGPPMASGVMSAAEAPGKLRLPA